MKKAVFFILTLFLSQLAFATDDDRLFELLEKQSILNAAGKELPSSERSELEKLISEKGLVKVAEMQNQLKQEKTKQAPVVEKKESLPVITVLPKKSPEVVTQTLKANSSPCDPTDEICKSIVNLKDKPTKQKEISPNQVGKTDLAETKDLSAEIMNEIKKEKDKKPEVKKTESKKALEADPEYLKRMKKDMEEINQARMAFNETKHENNKVKLPDNGAKGAIYEPLPGNSGVKANGFYVERDSQTIITRRIGPKDAITIKMCMAYGVSIILDESIDTELQRVILDDKIFFDAQEFENKRGVYVRLLKPIPQGNRWDSAIRLVRKSDDKTYVVNLQAVACPEGQIDFPKVVYLKEKFDVLTSRAQEVLTPEDMIIQTSQGLPRNNLHEITIYDMVASPGSDWVVFGIEVLPDQALVSPEKVEFQALDNLQINKLSVKTEFLRLQSDKASELRSQKAYRFKVMLMIDKAYVFKNRYVHLVYLNKETKHYQYIQVDTLNYFQSLKERGFDL